MDEPALGKPPAALNGARRKSGWGKRFKEREQGRLAIIFPRRKMGEAARGSDAVWLSVDVLNSLADRSLASAAKLLVSSRTPVCTLCVVPSTGFNAPLWRAREPPLCAPCSNRRKVSAGTETVPAYSARPDHCAGDLRDRAEESVPRAGGRAVAVLQEENA